MFDHIGDKFADDQLVIVDYSFRRAALKKDFANILSCRSRALRFGLKHPLLTVDGADIHGNEQRPTTWWGAGVIQSVPTIFVYMAHFVFPHSAGLKPLFGAIVVAR